ncbi:MAG: elongation factor G [Candidatus Sumerlaeota bacterium]|nr:elongation factor G [Candidatus Sumerlaeota bacterium]
MKTYTTDHLRNIALTGHTGAGKTTLVEAMLFLHKGVERLGRVVDGSTVSDYDPEEVKRQMSINASILPFETKTHKINILDLPGYRDFLGEIRNCLRVADGAVLVVDANAPVEPGAELAWEYAEEFRVPLAVFVNKMDKERADMAQAIDALKAEFHGHFVPVALPIGKESSFCGVVDLLRMKAVKDEPGKSSIEDIPADLADAAKEARAAVVEAAAEGDDSLLEKFLGDEELSPEEVAKGLRAAVAERRCFPVLCGAAGPSIGVQALVDFLVSTMPSPLDGPGLTSQEGEPVAVSPDKPFSAFVFKSVSDDYAGRLNFFKVMSGEFTTETTVANLAKDKKPIRISHILMARGRKTQDVDKLAAGDIGALSKLENTATGDTLCDPAAPVAFAPTRLPKPTCEMAISAKTKADEEKVGMGLHRMIEQDQTLELRRESETSQTLLKGMGDTHIEVAVSRLKTQSKVDVDITIPRVAYRETITRKAEAQGKYKKQSGGRGQYGDCHLRMEPAARGEGFSFTWEVVGGVVPTKFAPAIEKGLIEALQTGVLAGYPTVDVKAACFDGTFHTVDSSEMAFKVAASLAFKNVAPKAGPIILEPIVNVEIVTPEQYMGDIMGDLNSRRGRIMGMEHKGKRQIIRAQAPQAEMFTYSRDLRSMTQGRAFYTLEFSHYDPVPGEVQQKIIEDAAKRKEQGE